MTQDQKVARLEKRVKQMRALVRRMYHTFYSAQIRRSNTYGQLLRKTKDRLTGLSRNMRVFDSMSRISRELNRGRVVVTLDTRESQLLHAILRRQKPFKPRRR